MLSSWVFTVDPSSDNKVFIESYFGSEKSPLDAKIIFLDPSSNQLKMAVLSATLNTFIGAEITK